MYLKAHIQWCQLKGRRLNLFKCQKVDLRKRRQSFEDLNVFLLQKNIPQDVFHCEDF